MTKVEYINAFESDINSFINFVLLNNPKGLITSLRAAGYKDVVTYDDARKVLLAIYAQNKVEEFQKIMNAVPYINDVDNDTAGFQEYFLGKMTAEQRAAYDANKQMVARTTDAEGQPVTQSGGSMWLTIGQGALNVVQSFFGAKQSAANTALLQQQQLAEQAKTRKILIIGGVIIAVIILIIIGALLLRKK